MNKYLVLFMSVMVLASSCKKDKKDEENDNQQPPISSFVNPSDANAVSGVLVIPGSNQVDGDMPGPSNDVGAPDITMVDSSVAYSAGGEISLPIIYEENAGDDVAGIYCQVNGADNYFDIPVGGAGSAGTLLLSIGIPSNMLDGTFCLTISIYDSQGQVSEHFSTCVSVSQPMSCGIQRESGGEGLTSTLHDMGSQSGIVVIDYETFTVPDRIDVFYGGEWVTGTGSDPGPLGMVPPLADCSNPTEGYVGDNGTFCFPFNPDERGSLVEVVVSGCVRGGTAWNYTITCAGNSECDPQLKIVENTVTINGASVSWPISDVSAYAEAEESITGFNIGEESYFSSNGTRMVLFATSSAYALTNGFNVGADEFINDFNFQLEQDGLSGITTYGDDYSEADQGSISFSEIESSTSQGNHQVDKIRITFNALKTSNFNNQVREINGSLLLQR